MLPTFHDPSLLTTALTHRSALNERRSSSKVSNERLEFLGDAVLELVVSDELYHRFPKEQEGVLTAYRSALVKTTTLAEVARSLNLGTKLHMSHGEAASGGRENSSPLADALEAVIGALYLDGGYSAAQAFINTHITSRVSSIIAQKTYKDAKSALQELTQAKGLPTPRYIIESQLGPDHDKEFIVSVSVGKRWTGKGEGKSKQQAQQTAAQFALEHQGEWLV